MKPSVWSAYFLRLSPKDMVLAFQEAGYACTELSFEHSTALCSGQDPEKAGLAFRNFLADHNFTIPQGHLNFKKLLVEPATLDALKQELTLFAAIGIENAVLHINNGDDLPIELRRERQFSALLQLQDFVDSMGITLCLENLGSNPDTADADKLLRWIDALGGKNFGICFDTGHLHRCRCSLGTTEQTPREFILKAGKYLKALHIHGNDGTDDQHLAPFTIRKNMDWRELVGTLKETQYHGIFNLEVPGESAGNQPLHLLKRKLLYLKDLSDYMLSEHFPEQGV